MPSPISFSIILHVSALPRSRFLAHKWPLTSLLFLSSCPYLHAGVHCVGAELPGRRVGCFAADRPALRRLLRRGQAALHTFTSERRHGSKLCKFLKDDCGVCAQEEPMTRLAPAGQAQFNPQEVTSTSESAQVFFAFQAPVVPSPSSFSPMARPCPGLM